MSWLSEFLHSPIDYISENPLKALSLIAAPVAAVAAPFAFPALGSALGIGAGAGAGAGAAGAGILGAEGAGLLGAGAAEGAGLFGGLGGLTGAEGFGGLGSLFGGAEGTGLFGSGLFGSAELGAGASPALGFAAEGGAPGVLGSLGIDASSFGPEAFGSFASGAGETTGSALGYMPDFDWAARMFPGEFGPSSATFGDVMPFSAAGADAGGGAITAAPQSIIGAPFEGTAAAAAPAAQSGGGWLGNLGTAAWNSVMKNPIGVGLAGAGLGYNLLQGQKVSPEMQAMQGNAAALNAQGQQLMSYLQNGTLPPGLQTAVDNATHAMKARIIANHAKNGLSTNPAQNSALAQELNQVDLNAVALIAQQGQQLLTTGMNATNISSQLYGMLENLNRQQSQRTGQAIANFAAALSGGPRGININLGGQRAA